MSERVQPPANPLRFQSSMEQMRENEAELTTGLIETLRKISETTFNHSGHATRSVHAKSHGVLRGHMRVLDGLPPVLAQGLFAKPGSYPVAMRLSTVPGDILDDAVSTPRGLAVKIIGVEGERLPGSEADTTQDFVLVNGPAFGVSDPHKFLGVLKLLAATTDEAPTLKKIFSAVARGTEAVIEAVGSQSPALLLLGGHPETNILGETFYSQAPILYGPYIAKVAVAPASPELIALKDAPVAMTDRPNALREEVAAHFARQGGEWEIRVQLCTDLEAMPIEDASVVWPEDKSPYVAVARITAPAQETWSIEGVAAIDDGMSFSPWHGLAAHRPLGAVMRVRKAVYQSSANFRAEHNRCPIHEPRIDETRGEDDIRRAGSR